MLSSDCLLIAVGRRWEGRVVTVPVPPCPPVISTFSQCNQVLIALQSGAVCVVKRC